MSFMLVNPCRPPNPAQIKMHNNSLTPQSSGNPTLSLTPTLARLQPLASGTPWAIFVTVVYKACLSNNISSVESRGTGPFETGFLHVVECR